jgi:MraZ protein
MNPDGGSESSAFLSGNYHLLLDDKRRISLPISMRKSVPGRQEEYWVTLMLPERCVGVYPRGEWERIPQKMREERRHHDSPTVRERHRRILEHTLPTSVDKQGRITLSASIIGAAKLSGKVLVIGNLDHVEVWSPEVREEYVNSIELHETSEWQSMTPNYDPDGEHLQTNIEANT